MAAGFRFRDFVPDDSPEKGFESLFKIFMQLVTITSGDVGEALSWLNELDKQYGLTDNDYGMGNFIDDLKKKGYIDENEQERGAFKITPKTEQGIRKSALEEIFGKLKKGNVAFDSVTLTDEQAALRYTALLVVIQMIESLEPLLKEVSGKNQEEWQRWW